MAHEWPGDGASRPVLAACLLGLLIAGTACAPKRAASLSKRFVRGVDGPVAITVPQDAGGAQFDRSALPPDVPVPKSSDLPTVEASSAALGRAIAALGRTPDPTALAAVALEYHRLGVFDQAHAYLTRALAMRPQDARLFEARARVARDWGLADAALADAHRAVHFAPASSSARNTLGTVLYGLGQPAAAAAAFSEAVRIEPTAAWARSNLCYAALLGGDETLALAHCQAALARDAGLAAARNNLALVHASAGRLDDARREFLAAGPPAAGHYNFGIVLMALRDYDRARLSFEAALREAPAFDDAFVKAQEARALAARDAARRKDEH